MSLEPARPEPRQAPGAERSMLASAQLSTAEPGASLSGSSTSNGDACMEVIQMAAAHGLLAAHWSHMSWYLANQIGEGKHHCTVLCLTWAHRAGNSAAAWLVAHSGVIPTKGALHRQLKVMSRRSTLCKHYNTGVHCLYVSCCMSGTRLVLCMSCTAVLQGYTTCEFGSATSSLIQHIMKSGHAATPTLLEAELT